MTCDMPGTIENYSEEVAVKNVSLRGKLRAAFRSCWWSGEASKLVLEILRSKFGMNVTEPRFLAKYSSDQAALENVLL